MPGRVEARAQMPLQPEQFRHLHLGRDRAADIAQHVIPRLVDQPRLGDGAMVHPDDDIALLSPDALTVSGSPSRSSTTSEQVASKPMPLTASGAKRRFRHRGAHRGDAGRPDVGGGLLDDVAGLVPDPRSDAWRSPAAFPSRRTPRPGRSMVPTSTPMKACRIGSPLKSGASSSASLEAQAYQQV